MPRGTRAIHGGESDTNLSHASLCMVSAQYEWLPCLCWCESNFVWVTQHEVVNGSTRSCWVEGCVDFYGKRIPGDIIRAVSSMPAGTSARYANPDQTVEAVSYSARTYGPDAVRVPGARSRSRLQKVQERTQVEKELVEPFVATDNSVRRDLVCRLYEQGKKYKDIADKLGLSVHKVRYDIQVMHRQGRIRNYRSKGSGRKAKNKLR